METNPNEAHNRRILRPTDLPQNREDVAALKLLAAIDRQPCVEILRIVFYTGGTATEDFACLELKNTGVPEGVSTANLYARIELQLATINDSPVEALAALLRRRLLSVTAMAESTAMPSRTTLMAN